MNKKIAVISDLHIGNNKDNPVFHEITLKYAEWLKNILQEKNIKQIVIAGDFFHNRTSIYLSSLDVGHKFLDILKDFTIYITIGNHDSLHLNNSSVHSLAPFKTRKNIHIIDELSVYDNVTLVPWGVGVDDIPVNDITIGHFETISFEMSKGKICSHGIKASDIMNKTKLCLSGHFHTNQTRMYNGNKFIYLGSAFQLSFGESGNSNYVHIIDTETLDVEKILNDVSPRFEYISSESDFDKIKGNFVNIQINDGKEGDEFLKKVESECPINLKFQLKQEQKYNLTEDVKEFKIVDIPLTMESYIDALDNFSDEHKLMIKNLIVDLYNKHKHYDQKA
jgi:DNA repair exonuclease SbcCD nuclease subunit